MTGTRIVRRAAAKAMLAALLAAALALQPFSFAGLPGSKAFAQAATSHAIAKNVGQVSQYDGGTYVHDFSEGVLGVDGEVAFCMDPNVNFKPGQVTSADIGSIANPDQVTDMALRAHYARNVYADNPVPDHARTIIAQTLIWEVLSPGQSFVLVVAEDGGSFAEVTAAVRDDLMRKARDFAAKSHSKYKGHGTLWLNGSTQPVATLGCDLVVRDALVKVSKHDAESDWHAGLNEALGAASLEGARYTVAHYEGSFGTAAEAEASGAPARQWEFVTDERGIVDLSDPDSCLVSGNLYRDGHGNAVFPLGTYVVRESAPSEGYLVSKASSVIRVEQPGGTQQPTMSGDVTDEGGDAFVKSPEQVRRGDLSLVKVREDDMARLAGIPFLLTSDATGESHVLVTDENGRIDTSSAWIAHGQDTNASDAALKDDGTVDESMLRPDAGVWFGMRRDGSMADVKDDMGALPYDTYTMRELRCSANAGLALVTLPGIAVTRDGVVLDMGTVADKSEQSPYVTTYARDAHDGDKSVSAGRSVTVTDEVELVNLVPGKTYRLYGTVVDLQTGLPVLAAAGEDAASGTPSNPNDARDGSPEGTETGGSESLDADASAEGSDETAIGQEAVRSYWNGLLEMLGAVEAETERGASYEIPENTAVDMDAIRAYMEENADVSSKVVLASMEVTATRPNMTAALDYDMDASAMEGGYVIFDLLTSDGKVTATHADPSNEMQAFEVEQPSLRTEAADAADGDHALLPSLDSVVTDTVSYGGLVAGAEYVMNGTLVNKADGSLVYSDGKPVVVEKALVPESASGSVQLQFAFDSSNLDPGTELVVFEFLSKDGEDVAEHADLNDEAQTVTIGSVPSGKGYYKTGEELAAISPAPPAMVAAGAAAGAALFMGRMRLIGRRRA